MISLVTKKGWMLIEKNWILTDQFLILCSFVCRLYDSVTLRLAERTSSEQR